MATRNMKPIRGGYIATCKKCRETFIFTTGDAVFAEVDVNGDTWFLCSKC